MIRSELENKTVVELRQLCIHELSITGMSKKRKDIIIDAILNQTKTEEAENETASIEPMRSVDNRIVGIDGTFSSTIVSPNASFGNKNKTTIRVSAGASSGDFPVIGKSVGAVSEFLKEVLNVERMARGLINGKEVDNDYILKTGDILEYLKPAGKKG